MALGVFVHIPRTGGTSIKKALGIKKPKLRRHWDRYGPIVSFGHRTLASLTLPEDAFTFAFCRNPYDRAVSMWAFNEMTNGIGQSFSEFCANLDQWHQGRGIRMPQVTWMDGGRLDFLGRFENLSQDVDRLCEALGMDKRSLPHTNASKRGPCREHYDDRAQTIIRAYYAQDFEQFGYDVEHLPDEEAN